jgi:PHD/YefM family antitoxin component YafN of YafNO toxin-antitoxin module
MPSEEGDFVEYTGEKNGMEELINDSPENLAQDEAQILQESAALEIALEIDSQAPIILVSNVVERSVLLSQEDSSDDSDDEEDEEQENNSEINICYNQSCRKLYLQRDINKWKGCEYCEITWVCGKQRYVKQLMEHENICPVNL